jgi:hypothetical protein
MSVQEVKALFREVIDRHQPMDPYELRRLFTETIRLMSEIDKVITAHGGWPGAFQTAGAPEEPDEHLSKVTKRGAAYGSGRGNGEKKQ